MTVALHPDAHLAGWPPPEFHDPLKPPAVLPEPSGWRRRGGDPARPDKTLPSVFELHAESCRPPAKVEAQEKPAEKDTPAKRKRRRRR